MKTSETCAICLDGVRKRGGSALKCGHRFHRECLDAQFETGLQHLDSGSRMTFAFLTCPTCRMAIGRSDSPSTRVNVALELQEQVNRLKKAIDIDATPDKLAFYRCHRCRKAFFGGIIDCEPADAQVQVNAADVVCSSCAGSGRVKCKQHGLDYLEYKCRYCCTGIAAYFCGGTTHFCTRCHTFGFNARAQPCPEDSTCVFYGKHPSRARNGKDEYLLGCAACAGSTRAVHVSSQ
ncbi:RING-type domain-containing protein [Plasmodiophora brassicae]